VRLYRSYVGSRCHLKGHFLEKSGHRGYTVLGLNNGLSIPLTIFCMPLEKLERLIPSPPQSQIRPIPCPGSSAEGRRGSYAGIFSRPALNEYETFHKIYMKKCAKRACSAVLCNTTHILQYGAVCKLLVWRKLSFSKIPTFLGVIRNILDRSAVHF
jgi:hypothetical protein